MVWIYILLSCLPLALFLTFVIAMDSFSLTKWSRILRDLGFGVAAFIICIAIFKLTNITLENSKLLIAIIEEIVKGAVIFWLISSHRVGLLGDSTIAGSAIGAGFGLAENILHLVAVTQGMTGWHAIFIGFENAVMHMGCCSTLAMALIMVYQGKFGQNKTAKRIGIVASFGAAILIHWVHLLEPLPPLILTALLVVYFFISKASLFKKNKNYVHNWIDDCINNEIQLLGSLQRGEFSTTNAGKYMLTLKERYDPEVFFDMICFVRTYLELSIAAKSNMILKEAGMEIEKDPVNSERYAELKALRKRIGALGEASLAPIVTMTDVNRWAMNNLI